MDAVPDHNEENAPTLLKHAAAGRPELYAALLAALAGSIALFVLGGEVTGVLPVGKRIALVALAGLLGAVIAHAVLPWSPRRRRVHIARGGLVLLVVGLMLSPLTTRAGQRLTRMELAARSSALFITVDVASSQGGEFSPERWVVLDDVYAASALRDPALASVLIGRPVRYHDCHFDGDSPRAGVLTVGRTLALRGFDARVFDDGSLPDWCADGLSRRRGGLAEAVVWIAGRRGAPRFAHVHLEHLDAAAVDRAVAGLDADRVEVFVVSLVGTVELDDAARFLQAADVDVLVAWRDIRPDREPLPKRPRSAAAVAQAVLARLDVAAVVHAPERPLVPAIDGPGREPGEVVVSIAHREDGRPHRVLVHFDGGALAIEATPLGPRPGDWEADGASSTHAAYRNALRGLPPGPEREQVLVRLQTWLDASVWSDSR